jgi:hypothetical protein
MRLLRSLATLTVTVGEAVDRRLSAAVARHSAAQRTAPATHVTPGAIALTLLPATCVTRPETILAARRLTDGEIGRGPRGRRRAFYAWQRRTDQRPVNRTVFVVSGRIVIVSGPPSNRPPFR